MSKSPILDSRALAQAVHPGGRGPGRRGRVPGGPRRASGRHAAPAPRAADAGEPLVRPLLRTLPGRPRPARGRAGDPGGPRLPRRPAARPGGGRRAGGGPPPPEPRPFSQSLADAAAAGLRAVPWVGPADPLSGPPPTPPQWGQHFAALAVRALATGPQWRSSALVLNYDESGGFYDHVAPPPGLG